MLMNDMSFPTRMQAVRQSCGEVHKSTLTFLLFKLSFKYFDSPLLDFTVLKLFLKTSWRCR